jgi:hypothetical protein
VRKMASAGAVCCLWAIAQTRGGPPRQFELKAESPKFWELFAQDAKLEKITGGFGFPKGPVWIRTGSSKRQRRRKEQVVARLPAPIPRQHR